MIAAPETLIQDDYMGEPPSKRLLAYLQKQREKETNIVGIYCAFAPVELIRAFGLVPASLCAFSNSTIETAEAVLPANLCPLIKSSYGFILKDTCPFFGLSDAVIAETTCDGKKKMFELISGIKPMHVMDLPQLPDEPEALDTWTAMIDKLRRFLETTFHRRATDEEIEDAICDSNRKARLMNRIFDYAALDPPVVAWPELYDALFLASGASGKDMEPMLNIVLQKLERRKEDGYIYGRKGAPRVLVTGCPVGGDSLKVLNIIEEAGGVIVALDSCSGMKPYAELIDEGTGKPLRALAKRYLEIPCSCMTPNNRRLTEIDRLIQRFKPHAVVDVVLHACHSYNVESIKVGHHVREKHALPFLKIVTDYSPSDMGQIRTRVEALLETIPSPREGV
ncbi:MAG TPA: 2-hydroxyacyl-CoA dehydratase [Deltaproteobacteria bacterium]|nr:2-hydroxyacyl-CoA dehydratase [Deltaproteobacteria bacterium]